MLFESKLVTTEGVLVSKVKVRVVLYKAPVESFAINNRDCDPVEIVPFMVKLKKLELA